MKKLIVLGAAILGFTFLGQAKAQAHDYCAPGATVVFGGGYPVYYAPRYVGGYGYYQRPYRPYRPHYVRYANPYCYPQPRVVYGYGY